MIPSFHPSTHPARSPDFRVSGLACGQITPDFGFKMAHSYDVGTRAWQPDPTEGWIDSEVTEKRVEGGKVTLVFALGNGTVSVL